MKLQHPMPYCIYESYDKCKQTLHESLDPQASIVGQTTIDKLVEKSCADCVDWDKPCTKIPKMNLGDCANKLYAAIQGTIALHDLSDTEAQNVATDACQCSNMCGTADCSDHTFDFITKISKNTLEWLAAAGIVIGGPAE